MYLIGRPKHVLRTIGNYYDELHYVPGRGMLTGQQIADSAFATAAAGQAAINAGNPGAAATLALPNGARTLATQYNYGTQALTDLTRANIAVAGGQAENLQGQAAKAIAEGQAIQSTIPINQETAKAIAAKTYDQTQGGGISAQTYTALPFIIGGAFTLGLVGWLLYYNKRKRR